MATKPKIISSLDDLKADIKYTNELPEAVTDGTLVVVEETNQYFKGNNGSWEEINPYLLPL